MKKPVNLIHAPLINAHRYLCSAIILFLLNMSASLSATAQEKWTFVGKPGISTGRSIDPEVGLDSYGTPYVSYVETLGGQAVVKKYDGVEWVAIGGLPAVRYGMLSMAIGGDNYPCVALIDTASKNKITVLKYNGAIWEQLGTSIVANSIEASIKLNVNNGDLYVTYIDEGKNGVITVMKYINGIWSAVGATTLIDNYVRNFSLMFDNGGAPVLTYCNGVFSNSDTAYIGGVRFDGSVWTQICTRIAVTNNIYMSVMDKSGYLYVAYYKNVSSSGSVVRVSKFNGVGWESIGDTTYFNGSSLCVSIKTSLMIDCDSVLCMLYDAYGSGRPVLARYKNGSWKRLGTLMRNLPTYERVNAPVSATDCNGVYYVAFVNQSPENKVHVVRLGASGWTDVGDRVGDGYDRFAPQMYSLQFDSKGVGYVAFYSYAVSPALKIYTYNGASWLPMKLDKDSASYTYFKLSAKDTPYVFYNTFAEGTVIKKFDGTQWVRVKEVGTNNIEPYWGMFQFGKNDTLYSAGKDATGKFGVAKYDGLNWNVLADTLISTNMLSRVSFALDRNDKPHFAYGDINTGKATVIKCDNGVWSVLGMPSFSSGFMGFPSLAFDTSNVPYLAYANNHISQHNGSATVSKFDGVNWVNVGDTAFSDGQSLCSDIVFNRNNTPYVAYRDVVNNENVTVMKYLSGRWMAVGAEGFSHGNGDSYDAISLKIADNNTPYVGYVYVDTITDEAFVSVMKYGCPVQPQADICAVYTDTVTNKNIITWDGSTLPAIDSFRIYREDNGIYQYLGGVARDKYLFTDATAKPDVQSYRYKLVLVDNCEQEADTSSLNAHKSIQLTFNYLLQGIASVRWNTYEGRSNLIYTIKRSNNGAAFADLASFSIAGHDTTYLDVNPPSGSNEYRVDVALNDFCNVSGGSYDKITSNKVTAWNTGVEHILESSNGLLLVPNPADKSIRVVATYKISAVEVFAVTGKRLFSGLGYDATEVDIDVSQYPSGMYYLRVNGVNNASFLKR